MKRFLILICIILLSACQPLAVNSSTSTPSGISFTPIPSSTGTFTPAPSETLIPSATSTPQPPQSFSPASIRTFTPSSPATCPNENPSLEFDAKKAMDFSDTNLSQPQRHDHIIENVLSYLNSGGTLKSILLGFNKQFGDSGDRIIYAEDITADSVPELIFPYGVWIDVFGCKNGSYGLMFTDTYESDLGGVAIIDVTDINSDGLAETIVYFGGCFGNRCPIIRVYEWNGHDFQDLITNLSTIDGCSSLAITPFEVEIRDIDDNGTKEIIMTNYGYPHLDNDFPYRKETRICMWNGETLLIYKSEFDPPYYRFQAVQDGDRATLAGDYDKALGFYRQTVNDENLAWFTQDRKWYDFWMYYAKKYPQEPTPTASPALAQDPNEYPTLAAYAYYRMMLLYALQNEIGNAETTFNDLQSEFPSENPGNYFTKVASVFWQDYQSSMDIQQSCSNVIGYAQEHPLPTEYLGDSDHGVHSLQYAPETICPFK